MIETPYYLVDEAKLDANLRKVAHVRERSGARALLALKCFATWSAFDLMRRYMDGTTSSSLFEVRLGREKFGGETHAYSVAYADSEIDEVVTHADKIIFNSLGQLERYGSRTGALPCGLRLNPLVSSSSFDLADPARPHSRLGESDAARVRAALPRLSGFMIHNNCENADFGRFDQLLAQAEARFGELFAAVEWISLGGGIHFTGEGYPLDRFCDRLRAFSERYGVQVYLEPGEAAVTGSTTLEVSVLDTFERGKRIAIVDASVEAHMLDLLIYRESAQLAPNVGPYRYLVCGRSCLAGDIFGEFAFERELAVGDRLSILNAAGYTMVKKNWFNGVRMPAICLRAADGTVRQQRAFGYEDYLTSLS
ncbi:MAG: Carboxynorspermidine/carboxyspermidine decarboxylase [Steroidobacteraceae bacterium]|nr:Carboxynorspermidine/carboxyspermidine decarboxylase [Steroidobacteraceae bacterium]